MQTADGQQQGKNNDNNNAKDNVYGASVW